MDWDTHGVVLYADIKRLKSPANIAGGDLNLERSSVVIRDSSLNRYHSQSRGGGRHD